MYLKRLALKTQTQIMFLFLFDVSKCKKVKILIILKTVWMQPSHMRPCKAILVHITISFLHLPCFIQCDWQKNWMVCLCLVGRCHFFTPPHKSILTGYFAFFLWTSEAYGTGEFSCPILFSAQISTHSSLQAAGGWAGRQYLWWIQLICKKNWIALGLFLYNLAVWIPGTLRWSLRVKLHSVTLSDSLFA